MCRLSCFALQPFSRHSCLLYYQQQLMEKVIELLLCQGFNSNYFQLLLCSIAFFVSLPTSFLPPKVWISSHSIHKYSGVMLTDV